MYKILQKNLQK